MSRKDSQARIAVDGGGQGLTHNPFADLQIAGLPEGGAGAAKGESSAKGGVPSRGRLDLRRETAGRHGKAVVVVTPSDRLQEDHLRELARGVQRALGVGGTVKGNRIEIQGDRLAEIRQVLEEEGYRCRQTGG